MKALIKKQTGNYIQLIDGAAIETDTPSLFTDRTDLESINKTISDVLTEDEYELVEVDLKPVLHSMYDEP